MRTANYKTRSSRRFALPAAIVLLVAPQPGISKAADFATAPAKGSVSAVRLLSAGPMQGAAYRAGVEIALDPKAVTYWRQPGEAGSPPVFDFSKSENVAKVEIGFPVPKHIDEAGTIVAGYDQTVVFPLQITPKDPKGPATLALRLDYAACTKICLPAKAELSLALPQSGASPYAGIIADAEKRVPSKIGSAEARKRLALTKTAEGAWRVSVAGAEKAQDLFAEVAEPLFIESKPEGADFTLTLFAAGRKPAGADATLTVVTEAGAFEAPVRLE